MPSRNHRKSFPAHPERVVDARRFVADAIGSSIPASALEIVRLLTSEVFTNGVVHGSGDPIEVEVHLNDVVQVRITDTGPGFEAKPRQKRLEEPGGYGLVIVDRLADDWGVDSRDGTSVWFTIDAPVEPS